jgi:hypothetical protein
MSDVEKFLIANGLTKLAPGSLANNVAGVNIYTTHYEVTFFNEPTAGTTGTMYSHNLSIYWLIGVLTYYNVIDKNYKQ